MFRYEASVGGGIPILNALTTALLANEFEEILGIVNGTTNYILTQMTEYGLNYADVLKVAQEKGFDIYLDTRIESPHMLGDRCYPPEWNPYVEL